MPVARPRTLVLLTGLAAGAAGCQSATRLRESTYNTVRSMLTSSYHDAEAEQKYARAEELFKAGDFKAAQELFSDLAENTYNPLLVCEKSRFHEAECLRERKYYSDAVATYNRMLQDFPAGVYREQACARMYEIAYDWLLQGTLAEIEADQNGKPVSWWETAANRLPNPLDNTRPLLDVEGEAIKTMENVHTHDLLGPNADKALFWCGYIHFYRGRYEEADLYFSQLVEMHKDSKLRPQALKMAVIAKNNSTGGAVYDSQKASEALQLVHHAEATMPELSKSSDDPEWLTRQKLAVRLQLAEKHFRTAEYYERTNHPASAYFYYELVCRQHPGTKWSDMAKARIAELEKVRAKTTADRAAGQGTGGTWADRQWDRLMGRSPAATTDAPPADPTVAPAPTRPTAPRNLPADIGNPR
ncbi:MAG: tetratricopeptide repeat protein [Gemmataceae bacterium]